MKVFTSYRQYKQYYFPKASEEVPKTPEELGRYWADKALEKLREAVKNGAS